MKTFKVYESISLIKIIILASIPMIFGFMLKDYLPAFLIEGAGVIYLFLICLCSLYFYSRRGELGVISIAPMLLTYISKNNEVKFSENDSIEIVSFRSFGFRSILRPLLKIELYSKGKKEICFSASQVDLEELRKELLGCYCLKENIQKLNGIQTLFHLIGRE